MDTKPVHPTLLLQQLRWRYATKKFDSTRKIPADTWRALEEALVLTPSSYGLQPWKFIVVTDPEMKTKLLPVSWNQSQVADCSHLVVLAIKQQFGLKETDEFIQRTAEVLGVSPETLAGYRGCIVNDLVEGARSQQVDNWAANQVYIALGNFMTCAALMGIDACPMEGIESEHYDQILGLEPRGLSTVVVCAAGYRSEEDKYARLPKVRFEMEEVIERILPPV